MGGGTKRLDIRVGDVIEAEGHRYDVVPNKTGGMALEPAITIFADELNGRDDSRPVTQEEFEDLFGDIPSDGEG